MHHSNLTANLSKCYAADKDLNVGQKRPLLPKHVSAIRVQLEIVQAIRDLPPFNMAIESKLSGCDLVSMKALDVSTNGQMKERASVLQSKTQKHVRFEITERTCKSVATWLNHPQSSVPNSFGAGDFMTV